MLEQYLREDTIERIRSSWISDCIERYLSWLIEQGYAPSTVRNRVALLLQFGEFARRQGAQAAAELPGHAAAFSRHWWDCRQRRTGSERRQRIAIREAHSQVRQMLRLMGLGLPEKVREPFEDSAPGFFAYLREERGLAEATIQLYRYNLRLLEAFLGRRAGVLPALSPAVLSAFMIERSQVAGKGSLKNQCCNLRIFLRYLHREGVIAQDQGRSVESPQLYRLSSIPRCISRDEARRMLEQVKRSPLAARRDYAVMLLLLTYGMRAREVSAMRLDDIDWRRERLRIPGRKGGHSMAYPLSPQVGEALLEYLKKDRPRTEDRHVFLRLRPPYSPLAHYRVSFQAGRYLRRAGIPVPRAGSHTLRHSCAQRLVDDGFSLKQVGDYIGHRDPATTQIYTKVSIESLREVACGDGEEIL